MLLSDQMAIAIKAELARKGTTKGSIAARYAIAIGTSSCNPNYWQEVNQSLADQLGPQGRDSIKAIAWDIHNHIAAAFHG